MRLESEGNKESKLFTKLTMFTAFIFLMGLIILFISIIAALPNNPLSMKKSTESIVRQVIPQGWGFYSKDPRDKSLNIYPLTPEQNYPVMWPNNRVKNLFGIHRGGRAQGIELGVIVSNIPGDVKWTECQGSVEDCLSNTQEIYTVDNKTHIPTLCGEYIISFEEKIPWAYAKYSDEFASEAVKVEVKCTKN